MILTAAIAWTCLERAATTPAGDSRGVPPLPPNTDVVDMAALVPTYHGKPTTWDAVLDAKDAGKAQVVWVYSDDVGDYAYVFDTQAELDTWRCTPEGIAALHECPAQTPPTGARPHRRDQG